MRYPITQNIFTMIKVLVVMLTLLIPAAYAAENSSVASALSEAQKLISNEQNSDALNVLQKARKQFPTDMGLIEVQAKLLIDMESFGDAELLLTSVDKRSAAMTEMLEVIDKKLSRYTRNYAMAVIVIQKKLEIEDFNTAIAIADRALVEHPDKQADILLLKGEALYKAGSLGAAETVFRETLKIDPFNAVAKSYIEEIRTTEQAQVSEDWAEWVLIFKDKVGDFIVTFLALFAAFLVSSFVAPLVAGYKLNRARKAFEQGKFDLLIDLSEGLLDQEDFSTLRTNFRWILRLKGYDEAKTILDNYVVTLERLPSLQRILEREHDKMSASS